MSVKDWKDIRQKGLTKTENPCVGGSMEFIRQSSVNAGRRLISAHVRCANITEYSHFLF